jgi:hypothetical protein
MTRYSERKKLLRARLRAPVGWTALAVFAALCILAAVLGPRLDAAIGPQLDAWYDAHMRQGR